MSWTRADYPLAERHADDVKGKRGKPIGSITLDAILSGGITMDDLRITPDALRSQAGVSRDVGRTTLAANFERASELVDIPQDFIMRVYELLRPGRAKSAGDLLDAARIMRETHKADRIARFIEEAALVYGKRGLFTQRF
ncbi:MAG: diol dehydratase small subunit [Aestuariivirga sp.]